LIVIVEGSIVYSNHQPSKAEVSVSDPALTRSDCGAFEGRIAYLSLGQTDEAFAGME
jgi:hypothetical protein